MSRKLSPHLITSPPYHFLWFSPMIGKEVRVETKRVHVCTSYPLASLAHCLRLWEWFWVEKGGKSRFLETRE